MSKPIGPETPQDRNWIARLMSVTPGTVTKWAVNENLPVAEGGGHGRRAKYVPITVVRWRHERDAARFAGAQALNPAQERAARDRAQAELTRQLHAKRSGEVLEREDVAAVWSQIVVSICQRILGMPATLATRLVGLTEPAVIERLVRDECYSCLRDLASWEPEPATTKALRDDAANRGNGRTPA